MRAQADRLGLDYGHFTGQRRWSDAELSEAVAQAQSWTQVAEALGLAGGSGHATVKGHAARLGIPTSHLESAPSAPTDGWVGAHLQPRPDQLARSGSLLAVAWFTLCGHTVSWPLEPAVYDLLVEMAGRIERVQVKTTTYRTGRTWVVRLQRSGASGAAYDPEEIDWFFIIDGEMGCYLIPVDAVGGLHSVHLTAYEGYRVGAFADGLATQIP
ncbi:group I intron-associated PD-(D/E)XK endonuclease [Nocardioides sp. KR10-350]